MASLSERLKRERELRGISLKQISEETRIGVRFLQALEDDRLEVIPGEFYRRSYLRAYTRYLGLDEDRALNVYDYSRKDKSSQSESGGEPGANPPAGIPAWLKWAGASLGIGVAVVLLVRAIPAPTAPPASTAPTEGRAPVPDPGTEQDALPTPDIPLESPARALDPAPSPFLVEASPVGGALRLVLSVEESCWLEIAADGEVVVSGLKDQGFRQEVTALRELRLWLGNAGGVKLLLNDEPAIPLGQSGQVRRDLTITPDNYRDFVSSAGRS